MFQYIGDNKRDQKALLRARLIMTFALAFVVLIASFGEGLCIFCCWQAGFSVWQMFAATMIFAIISALAIIPLGGFLSFRVLLPAQDALDRFRTFIMDAGHDLATPINVISSRMQIIERANVIVSDHEEDIAAINTAMKDLITQVDDLRALAHSDSGRQRSDLAMVDLTLLAGESIAELDHQSAARGIKLCLDAPHKVVVIGQALGLKRVISNLLTNAIKYGTEKTDVKISLLTDAKNASVTISSAGAPIPPGELPNLFNRYYRVHEYDSHSKGSGLGLAIVKAIIDSHNGTVKVVSDDHLGNVFLLQLPKHPIVHPALSIFE